MGLKKFTLIVLRLEKRCGSPGQPGLLQRTKKKSKRWMSIKALALERVGFPRRIGGVHVYFNVFLLIYGKCILRPHHFFLSVSFLF